MNVPLFLVLTAVGSAVWNTVLVLTGTFSFFGSITYKFGKVSFPCQSLWVKIESGIFVISIQTQPFSEAPEGLHCRSFALLFAL